nr:roadblock/LC7 domain-containing protein [Nocardiopsis quinghaiensis]
MSTTATEPELQPPRSRVAREDPSDPAFRVQALVQALVRLVEDNGAKGGVVFGRDGLHLARAGMDQVQAERATAMLNGLHLFSREAGRRHERGDVETVVVRYRHGAVVIAPLAGEAAVALVVDESTPLQEVARALAVFTGSVQHLLPPPRRTARRATAAKERT